MQTMKRYDYSFLRNISLPAELMTFTNFIYALRSVEGGKKTEYPDLFTELQKIAVLQSVKSSNAIEGILTTDKRLREIVDQNSAPLNHNEREIAGYRDALNMIHTKNEEMNFSEELTLELHRVMLAQTGRTYGGKYKEADNVIREVHTDGTSYVRWTPVSAKDTPKAMEQFFLAYMDARDDSGIDNLLLIPCVILDFLCIHPFSDGNGRLSRLLSLLLLYKAGFDIPKYVSFEEKINKEKSSYYEALKLSSYGWHDNANDYVPFIKNFLFTLFLCYQELDKRFLTLGTKKTKKKLRVEHTLENAFLPISKKEISELLPDISVTTIEKVLSSMLKSGKIKKIGNTSNARYIKNN